MKFETITIISKVENDLQAWTFQIEESDFLALVEKYGEDGCSVRGSANDIKSEFLNGFGVM